MINSCVQAISAIEDHSSRLNKEAIVLAEAEQGNDMFFEAMRFAFSAMITFGVKKVPESTTGGAGLEWDEFKVLAMDLAERRVTGHDARDAIEAAMAKATIKQWNGFYRRILIKDMRAGFSEGTINRVTEKKFPQYMVPVFSCQLAHDSANHESKVTGKKLIEVKLDGVRVITIVQPNGRVDQYSRNGKELVNFPHVKEQFTTAIKHAKLLKEAIVFDGEIMSSSFQDLMKQIHRKSSAQANDAVLNVFDMMSLSDFEAGGARTNQLIRSQNLKEWVEKYQEYLPNVSVVGQELVDLDTAAGLARYKEINKFAIDNGYEGIMLKDPYAGYECKRSVAWLKLKPYIEVTLRAVAVEEGTGKYAGMMGAVLFEGEDDDKFIRVSVGSGFSDKQRKDIWEARGDVIGELGEIRADAATKNQDSDDVWSLRFPRFKTWRGFARGEKL